MKRSRRHLSLWQKLLIRAMMLALPIYIFSKPAEAEPFAYVAHNAGIGTVSVINSAHQLSGGFRHGPSKPC